MRVSFYERDTGRFTGYKVECPLQFIGLNAPDGCYGIGGDFDSNLHYVLNHEAVERPEMPLILDDFKISNIPLPAKLTINGTEYDVDESEVDLEFPYPGEYSVQIESWPYKTRAIMVVK